MVVNSMNIYIQTHTLFNIKTNLPVFFLGFDIVHASSSNGYAPIYFYAFFAIAYTPQPTPPHPDLRPLASQRHRPSPQPTRPPSAIANALSLCTHFQPTRPGLIFSNTLGLRARPALSLRAHPRPTRPPPA